MEKVVFRIVKKSKEGALIENCNKKVLIPWNELNELYIVSEDKLSCWFNEETQKKFDKADEILTDIVTCQLMANSPDAKIRVTNVLQLSKLMGELQDTLGIDYQQALQLAKERFSIVSNQLNFKSRNFGFGYEKNNKNKFKQKQSIVNMASLEDYTRHGECLGDNSVLQNLKKQFEKDGK